MIQVYNKVANPFPGLRSFEFEDAALFFGRDNQIRELREKLSTSRFLAIIGSSGSGKSSVVKAGLVPQLINSKLPNTLSKDWQVVSFNPEASPIRNLARALQQSFPQLDRSVEELEALLYSRPEEIISWLRNSNLLVVIDQFEEIFRYRRGDDNREEIARFIDLLLNLSRKHDYPVYVVLTMRSDYLDACTDFEGLTEAINHGYYLLPKMNREEIFQVITTPIQVSGAEISEELTTRLLNEIGDRADHLPILQHALMRTWNHWELTKKAGNPIEVSDYEAIGTIDKAISVHAEEVYGELTDEKSRVATEKMFKALIYLGPGDSGIIQPTTVRDIGRVTGVNEGLLIDVLDRFREPGVAFLTPPTAVRVGADHIIDISHERIMNLWERLQIWVKEETDSAKFYRQLSNSARLYHEGKTGLWLNPELQIGLKWLKENRPTQEWANRYDPYYERAINFLDYSKNQYDFDVQSKEERQKRELKRARFFAVFLGIGSLISLLFLIISVVLRTQAKQSEKEALEEKKIALFERTRAEEQTREAITQKKIAEQQEIIAEQQKRLTEEQRVIAVKEQKTAEEKRREAELSRMMAVEQQKRAEEARNEAEQQKVRAETAQKDAEQQKGRAQVAQKDAEQQRSKAETAQQYAEQQRGKAIARTVAIQSYQMAGNAQDELPVLLALQAYTLNLKNGGQYDNPDIFNALSKAADAGTVLRRHNDLVRAVAIQPGSAGNGFASASDDGTVKLWNDNTPKTFAVPKRITDGFRSLVFSKDGKTLLAGSEKGQIFQWNAAQPEAPPAILKAHTGPVHSLLFTPNFARMVSIGANGSIRTWKMSDDGLDSLQHVRTGFDLYCAKVTPDGKSLVCGSSRERLLVFDLDNLKKGPEVFTRRGLGNRVTAVAFSPDGERLITGNSAGVIYSWGFDAKGPDQYGSPLSGPHTSTVNDIIFTPNGKLMASCSSDWSIHIWNYSTLSQQQQPIVIRDFDAWVTGIRFTADSKRLVACGADKTIRIRSIDTAVLHAQLLKKVSRNMTAEEWNKYIGKDIPYERIRPE